VTDHCAKRNALKNAASIVILDPSSSPEKRRRAVDLLLETDRGTDSILTEDVGPDELPTSPFAEIAGDDLILPGNSETATGKGRSAAKKILTPKGVVQKADVVPDAENGLSWKDVVTSNQAATEVPKKHTQDSAAGNVQNTVMHQLPLTKKVQEDGIAAGNKPMGPGFASLLDSAENGNVEADAANATGLPKLDKTAGSPIRHAGTPTEYGPESLQETPQQPGSKHPLDAEATKVMRQPPLTGKAKQIQPGNCPASNKTDDNQPGTESTTVMRQPPLTGKAKLNQPGFLPRGNNRFEAIAGSESETNSIGRAGKKKPPSKTPKTAAEIPTNMKSSEPMSPEGKLDSPERLPSPKRRNVSQPAESDMDTPLQTPDHPMGRKAGALTAERNAETETEPDCSDSQFEKPRQRKKKKKTTEQEDAQQENLTTVLTTQLRAAMEQNKRLQAAIDRMTREHQADIRNLKEQSEKSQAAMINELQETRKLLAQLMEHGDGAPRSTHPTARSSNDTTCSGKGGWHGSTNSHVPVTADCARTPQFGETPQKKHKAEAESKLYPKVPIFQTTTDQLHNHQPECMPMETESNSDFSFTETFKEETIDPAKSKGKGKTTNKGVGKQGNKGGSKSKTKNEDGWTEIPKSRGKHAKFTLELDPADWACTVLRHTAVWNGMENAVTIVPNASMAEAKMLEAYHMNTKHMLYVVCKQKPAECPGYQAPQLAMIPTTLLSMHDAFRGWVCRPVNCHSTPLVGKIEEVVANDSPATHLEIVMSGSKIRQPSEARALIQDWL